MRFWIVLLACLALAPAARADLDTARAAYAEGHWSEAAALAQRNGGAEGYALAASALLAQLMIEPEADGREDLADRAFELADYAHDLDEDNVSARLQLAGALGYRGRYMNGIGAYMRRVPQRGRNLLESVLEDEPSNAWATGMLGAWHLEVARRGGQRGLRTLDASIEAGIGYYTNAIALDPHNPAPRFFFAVALFALDDEAYYAQAVEQARIAAQLEPRNAFEEGIHSEAEILNMISHDRPSATRWSDQRMRM